MIAAIEAAFAARCRWRPHQRYPLDPPHHREDRNRTPPPSTSRSFPGPSPASSRISTTGCPSTTNASRQAPAQTATSSFSTSPSSTRNSPNAACPLSASIPRSASWSATSRNRHLPRHPRLRCRQPGQMVATRRPRTLLRRLRATGARRLRQQQRAARPLLQVCPPDRPR